MVRMSIVVEKGKGCDKGLLDSTFNFKNRTEMLRLICEKGNQGNQRLQQESHVNRALTRKIKIENAWLE